MIKFAKVINEKTKEVDVGFSEDEAYFKSLGMERMDVSPSADGRWFLTGYVPEDRQLKIRKLLKFLNDTDWYVSRFTETGVEIPEDVKEKRAEARKEIDRLRELKDEEL